MSKMTETKLRLSYLEVSERFSLSNMLSSLARDTILPGISDLLGELIQKVEKNSDNPTETRQEENRS